MSVSRTTLPFGPLLLKLKRLALPDQATAWSTYRYCRRVAVRGLSEEAVTGLAHQLSCRVHGGDAYPAVVLGLKIARAYTLATLRGAGASGRRPRELAKEGFHLVRLQLRAGLGMRAAEGVEAALFGAAGNHRVIQAWSDAGVRGGRAAAAFHVQSPDGSALLQSARTVATTNALEAELEAAELCLAAMLAAGVDHARLNVDALGVLRAFQGRLALKFCVQEARLLRFARAFKSLEVRLVPRAFNDLADRLASSLL